nr:ribosomal protein S4 [Xyris indica]
MPAFRFKTCRLLLGNVRNRELSLIQRRILRRLRNKRRSMLINLSLRENRNSNIKSQTTRKLSLYYGDGDLAIRGMHRGRERRKYLPFLLNQESRSDVIPVRLHFSDTLPQARQPISHRRVLMNKRLVSITHRKVSHGDLISFLDNEARTFCCEQIRGSFYIDISVGKIIGKFLPVRMWRRTKTEWFRLLKTRRGCRLLLKSRFLQELRQEKHLERRKKKESASVCLGSSLAEHNRMKRNFFQKKDFFLFLFRKEKNTDCISRARLLNFMPFVYKSSLYSNWTSCSGSPFTRKIRIKRPYLIGRLPTHYLEVNHRTPKAVVFYRPNIGHIPRDIRLKDPNLPLRSGVNIGGQNI